MNKFNYLLIFIIVVKLSNKVFVFLINNLNWKLKCDLSISVYREESPEGHRTTSEDIRTPLVIIR